MTIHIWKLFRELQAAGLPVIAVFADGHVNYARELSSEEKATASTVIDAHDPNRPTPEELDEQAAQTAKLDFRNLPQWATWSPQEGQAYVREAVLSGQTADQVEAWINTNVTSLATAKTALILLARNLVVLREIAAIMALAILYLRDVAVRKVS